MKFLVRRNLREVLRESLKLEMRRASGQIALGIQFDNEFLISREVSIVAAINDKVFVPTAIHVSSALDIVPNYWLIVTVPLSVDTVIEYERT